MNIGIIAAYSVPNLPADLQAAPARTTHDRPNRNAPKLRHQTQVNVPREPVNHPAGQLQNSPSNSRYIGKAQLANTTLNDEILKVFRGPDVDPEQG